MEDIVTRVGRLETSMSDVRVDVAAVVGTAMACAGLAFAAAKLIS
jgi:hypothetical protein